MWLIHFIPDECDSIAVNINGQQWTTWHSSDGNKVVPLPAQWRDNSMIHVYASVHPERKNGSLDVLWDSSVRQQFRFDRDEDHDVHRPDKILHEKE